MRPFNLLTIFASLVLGYGANAVEAAAPAVPDASARPAPDDRSMEPRPVRRQPPSVINAVFTAPAGQSPLATAVQRAKRAVDGDLDAFTLHAYRSQDADAPAVEAVGSTQQSAPSLGLAPELLAVRTAPGALVAFRAAALGTFANGCNGIIVVADSDGLARVAFRAGQDGGDYQVMAVSPARSGVALFQIHVE